MTPTAIRLRARRAAIKAGLPTRLPHEVLSEIHKRHAKESVKKGWKTRRAKAKDEKERALKAEKARRAALLASVGSFPVPQTPDAPAR